MPAVHAGGSVRSLRRQTSALRRQVPDTSGKPAQRDVPGTGSMPGPPLRGFPHIQKMAPCSCSCLACAALALGRRGKRRPSHPLMLPSRPLRRSPGLW